MTSKKKLKRKIVQLREVVKCERAERIALDRHCDHLLTIFNEECARNEKLHDEIDKIRIARRIYDLPDDKRCTECNRLLDYALPEYTKGTCQHCVILSKAYQV